MSDPIVVAKPTSTLLEFYDGTNAPDLPHASLPRILHLEFQPQEIYRVLISEEYEAFLAILKEYLEGDCWALTVDKEVIFNAYRKLTVKQELESHILRDKFVDCPHLLFTEMIDKEEDAHVVVYMHGKNTRWLDIRYNGWGNYFTVNYYRSL